MSSKKPKKDKSSKNILDKGFIPCTLKTLAPEQTLQAARLAVDVNPNNQPLTEFVALLDSEERDRVNLLMEPGRLAVLTSKMWRNGLVRLTVSFMDNPSQELKNKILAHMNAWNKKDGGGNVGFVLTDGVGVVRIARENNGYWSYLGTDVMMIPQQEQTMNLQGFTINTRDSEFHRVVRHETGHTLGFPHEHMRRELIDRLDPVKTVQYFRATQGWSRQEVYQQVLTPLDERSIRGTPEADDDSIMCYQLPGSITKDGRPIPGGSDINELDYQFVAKIYPKPETPTNPPQPPTPVPDKIESVVVVGATTYKGTLTKQP